MRIICLAIIMCLAPQFAQADEVYTRTEYRCDETTAEFEMANYTIHDSNRVTNIKRPWENPLKNAQALKLGETICNLKTEPPMSIVIKGNRTGGNIQGMCGALSGSEQFILTINDKKVAWPSDYYRCFGSLPGRQMQDFENQMHWPTYLKINSKSITMYNSKPFDEGITDFHYGLTKYFLETDDSP